MDIGAEPNQQNFISGGLMYFRSSNTNDSIDLIAFRLLDRDFGFWQLIKQESEIK